MKHIYYIIFALICVSTMSYSQQKSQQIYKDASGKVLSQEEVAQITKGTYSRSEQTTMYGDKIITLMPLT